jgi:hypothetical protein
LLHLFRTNIACFSGDRFQPALCPIGVSSFLFLFFTFL